MNVILRIFAMISLVSSLAMATPSVDVLKFNLATAGQQLDDYLDAGTISPQEASQVAHIIHDYVSTKQPENLRKGMAVAAAGLSAGSLLALGGFIIAGGRHRRPFDVTPMVPKVLLTAAGAFAGGILGAVGMRKLLFKDADQRVRIVVEPVPGRDRRRARLLSNTAPNTH